MSNLGPREKYLIILLGIGLLILAIYLLGIKPLSDKNYNLEVEQAQLQAKLDYYKALQASNEQISSEIEELNNQIQTIEKTFIPVINTESLENYVMSVFEDNGCPYLVGIGTEDVQSPSFLLPDGTVADETLAIKRVTVTYATTDAFCIPDYNHAVSLIDPATGALTEDQAVIDAFLEQLQWQGSEAITGYNEFLAALSVLKDENTNCIKITGIQVDNMDGYLQMTATIDFFSANLTQRVSEATSSAPYVVWSRDGSLAIPTGAGMIGMPLYCDNADNAWYGYYVQTVTPVRPFANTYSAYYFSALAGTVTTPGALNIEGEETPVETPDEGEEIPA